MMKHVLLFLVLAIATGSCGNQPAEVKKDSAGGDMIGPATEFVPRGELVTSYEAHLKKSSDRHWIEIYLLITKDSIIVTEVEKLSKESIEPPVIFRFDAAREQLDLNTIQSLPYDAVKEPAGMMKVSVEIKPGAKMVRQWVSDPRAEKNPQTIEISGIRVLVKDQAQAEEITAKLKKGS